MIIKGHILTNKGYIDVSNLNKECRLINHMAKPVAIKKLRKSKVSKVIKFKNNPDLEISLDSKVATLYGVKDVSSLVGKTVYVWQMSGRVISDEAIIVHLEKPVVCYNIELEDGSSYFCENYPLS